jgi:hypothetical protein
VKTSPATRNISTVISQPTPLSSFLSAEAARWVSTDFSFFVKELGALLAEFFTVTMFQLADR